MLHKLEMCSNQSARCATVCDVFCVYLFPSDNGPFFRAGYDVIDSTNGDIGGCHLYIYGANEIQWKSIRVIATVCAMLNC